LKLIRLIKCNRGKNKGRRRGKYLRIAGCGKISFSELSRDVKHKALMVSGSEDLCPPPPKKKI
jgi:hypothetical protein